MPFVGADSLLMQYNVQPHMAQQVLKFLQEVEIARSERPTYSSDFNTVEHVWYWLGRCVWGRTLTVNTLSVLRTTLQEEREGILEEVCVLFDMVLSQLWATIRAHGGNIYY